MHAITRTVRFERLQKRRKLKLTATTNYSGRFTQTGPQPQSSQTRRKLVSLTDRNAQPTVLSTPRAAGHPRAEKDLGVTKTPPSNV